jgi:hypothetical protein
MLVAEKALSPSYGGEGWVRGTWKVRDALIICRTRLTPPSPPCGWRGRVSAD